VGLVELAVIVDQRPPPQVENEFVPNNVLAWMEESAAYSGINMSSTGGRRKATTTVMSAGPKITKGSPQWDGVAYP
jgi:hypothetical protein